MAESILTKVTAYSLQLRLPVSNKRLCKHHTAPQATKLNISIFRKEYKINCVIEINISCLSSSQNRKIFLVVYVHVFE